MYNKLFKNIRQTSGIYKAGFILIVFLLGMLSISCVDDHSLMKDKMKDKDEGFSRGIQELIVETEVLRTLERNGMIIHEGISPPYIEGVYYASPLIFTTNAKRALDMMLLLENQKAKSYKNGQMDNEINLQRKVIDYSTGEVTSTDRYSGLISGHGNKFSIIILTENNTIEIYSGEIDQGGLKDFYFAIWDTEENSGFVMHDKASKGDKLTSIIN